MVAPNEKSFGTADDGKGAHVRAPRVRSGAMGSPRSARVGSGAEPRLDKTQGVTPWRTTG